MWRWRRHLQWHCCRCDLAFALFLIIVTETNSEFVAGIAGIVVFMGFLQLVIIILKLRGRH
jgi:hypothetical protein